MQNPTALTGSRIQLHYAIQFMAATGMALVEAQPDGSQMTLDWCDDLKAFIGQRILGDRPCYLALDPVQLISLILDDQQQAIASFPLIGKTMETALNWHKAELSKLGVDAEKIAFLSYPNDFPDHPLAHGAQFASGDEEGRKTVAAYFAVTYPLLYGIIISQAGASPIYIWPHHFDMATLVTLAGEGASAQTIGAGFSPGDNGYNQPYWYVTPWPYPDKQALPSLAVGTWHTEGWIGAILLADELAEATSATTQQTVKTFLETAVSVCHKLLT
ncbi:hypothetical protein [Almyronema epifaneia]|uniref:Uncharacterized protein n=1 Tax=Almyronema epifaneia S1 TaxID=2991925 RepID=A0ABW6ICG6_9CYAN